MIITVDKTMSRMDVLYFVIGVARCPKILDLGATLKTPVRDDISTATDSGSGTIRF